MSKEILYGKNVVLEVLKARRRKVFRLFWARKKTDPLLEELQKVASEHKIPVSLVSPDFLIQKTGSQEHQGIACETPPFEYAPLEEAAGLAKKDPKGGFLLLLDEIQDPHNVGALIRTAHLCGAAGMVLLKHRQALVTPAVCKAAAGAQEHLPIVKEINLVNVINYLKKNDFFVTGASVEGESLFQWGAAFPLGLVLGSEGRGLRRLVAENCDKHLTIPMEGRLGSFNVSVAGGIFMAEIMRHRLLSS